MYHCFEVILNTMLIKFRKFTLFSQSLLNANFLFNERGVERCGRDGGQPGI